MEEMNIAKIRVLGSTYAGLFCVANDNLCLVPTSIDDKTMKIIEEVLEVKAVKGSIYGSSLLSVFAKMNNKHAYLPSFAEGKEVEAIEKEIKVKLIPTENALGNMMEVNDTGAIVSKTLGKKAVDEMRKTGLMIAQTNIAKTDVTGSCIVATNRGFLVNPYVSKEEAELIASALGVKGGSATANTGDMFVRNSVLANKKGILVGENTTPHEINKIEEALAGEA
ncbi:Translation initiation factor 6 [uncultured archaeon]|nr:Translation initiation factor 6 [uncultured archaeon]